MEAHILPTEDLTGIYRFAVLLAGSPQLAQAVVLEAFADAGEKIHHFRSGKSCEAWLAAKVRTRLLNKSPQESAVTSSPGVDDANPAMLELARRFSTIPEPGRSALALLYINRFSPQEIAQILRVTLEELADVTGAARETLKQMDGPVEAAAPLPGGQES